MLPKGYISSPGLGKGLNVGRSISSGSRQRFYDALKEKVVNPWLSYKAQVDWMALYFFQVQIMITQHKQPSSESCRPHHYPKLQHYAKYQYTFTLSDNLTVTNS